MMNHCWQNLRLYQTPRLLIVKTLGNAQSKEPLCPSNTLTMKSKVVLSLPCQFVKTWKFSRRRWRCIQHITNEFWVRWHNKFLWSLQTHQKLNNKCRNFGKSDIVLLKTDVNCNQQPVAKVFGVNADDMGFIRIIPLLLVSYCDCAGEQVLK